ncbi:MAG: sulfatase [Armatimonadota bacterium]
MNLSRREFMRRLGLTTGTLALPHLAQAAAPARRPNVILFLADDLGWMDSSLYGSQYYETPNLERLAQRGMMFTDAYAANPLCSPTRASIMTGKYPARLRITTPACHLPAQPDEPLLGERTAPHYKMVCPRSRRFLPLEEYTIGEAFRDAGYSTGFIGKWHLGRDAQYWPREQGFDFDLGAPNPGPPSYFSPYKFQTIEDGPEGEYITDRVTDEALTYVQQRREDPFLLCLWHFAVHAPFQAKEEITKTYRGKVDPRGRQDCPIMASMIQSLDESVGRVLDKLDELGIADRTIVIFMSDNGGNMYDTVEGTTPTNNAPLRGGKATIYEGGTREPCVIVWPGVVEPGTTCSEVISSIDFYPTMLEMAGIEGRSDHLVDGESIVPLLKGRGKLQREAIFCHFPHYVPATKNLPSTYVRKGDWKLIRFYGEGPNRSHAYELYNLRDDVGETSDLADREPAKVGELDALITQHLEEIDAIVPIPNPNYDPRAFNPMFDEPIHGWIPSPNCNLSVEDGILQVTSFNNDPHFHTTEVPSATGPVTVELRIKCSTQGNGQVFWTTPRARAFHRTRSVTFELSHDGTWHEHSLELPVDGRLMALRLDPGTAPGEIEIDWVRIRKPDGVLLKAWDF